MKRLRTERGLTQAEVARHLGIRQSTYAMIEAGHRFPRPALAKALADFFQSTVDDLFFARGDHKMQSQLPSQGKQTDCEIAACQ
ncbi:MAG: helix-turn-helix transcriptional regulator [Firmicutes bacterium]|nr:helix-turn-helix transcriptional regulator [Bacillota bacterium]